MDVRECKISVPWGHMAVKTFGNEEDDAIFAIHGLLDNAATFDRLIPLLPRNFFYICIDLPGHGFSSYFPEGLPIYALNLVYACKLILDHYAREKYIILGHSLGSTIGLFLAQLYPKVIEKLIMIDCLYFIPVLSSGLAETIYHVFDSNMELSRNPKNGDLKTYTYEEALQKLLKCKLFGEINREATETLLKRCLKPIGDGSKYVFTLDQRYKFIFFLLHDVEYAVQYLKSNPINFPLLIIMAEDSIDMHTAVQKILDEYKNGKNVTVKTVKGNHHVHNSTPEVVAPLINEFLISQKSKL